MSAAWNTCFSATDASLYGLGACHKTIQADAVAKCGRVAEKWRDRTEDFIQARLSGLEAAFFDVEQIELENELVAEQQL